LVKDSKFQLRIVDGLERWGIEPTWIELTDGEVFYRLTFDAGGVLKSFAVETTGPTLTATLVKNVAVGAIEHAARRIIRDRIGESADSFGEKSYWLGRVLAKPKTDAHTLALATVARRYSELVEDDDCYSLVADELSYSRDTVITMVKQARRAGLLTPTTRGKGGGSLTADGARVLGLLRPAWEAGTAEQRQSAIDRDNREIANYSALVDGHITRGEYLELHRRLYG